LTPSWDLFVCARNLFDGANGKTRRAISAASLLADQQNKSSGSYQQGKQNTGDERNNPMPTGVDFFRSSAFLRRSDTQPEEKFGIAAAVAAVFMFAIAWYAGRSRA
jgi:hypothetical protein